MPYLSIIIPAHNEERRLPASLDKILKWIKTKSFSVEVLVIENGSSDATFEIACQYHELHPEIIAVSLMARGKGRAVRYGMLHSEGRYRFMCDADLSMPIEWLDNLMSFSAPVVIASREAKGAIRFGEPQQRHFTGRVFNTLAQMVVPGIQDTQCGFKLFNYKAARDIFSRSVIDSMAFDVEVLHIARVLGYQIEEVPVVWDYDPDSRVRLIRDSIEMAVDIMTIKTLDYKIEPELNVR